MDHLVNFPSYHSISVRNFILLFDFFLIWLIWVSLPYTPRFLNFFIGLQYPIIKYLHKNRYFLSCCKIPLEAHYFLLTFKTIAFYWYFQTKRLKSTKDSDPEWNISEYSANVIQRSLTNSSQISLFLNTSFFNCNQLKQSLCFYLLWNHVFRGRFVCEFILIIVDEVFYGRQFTQHWMFYLLTNDSHFTLTG